MFFKLLEIDFLFSLLILFLSFLSSSSFLLFLLKLILQHYLSLVGSESPGIIGAGKAAGSS